MLVTETGMVGALFPFIAAPTSPWRPTWKELTSWGTSVTSDPLTFGTGRVIGRFYGEDGLPTPELTQVEAMITKGLEANKQELKEKQKFPPCNAEWSAARGGRFWCSQTR
uniref:Cytochrome b5 domain containing 2 n=1 Tax=Molossus molossus TaxID=27622 RepID=A0A7J8CX13_MOLMO|nr:cytochrome b5 domain containing 2 [Molossus molossus]